MALGITTSAIDLENQPQKVGPIIAKKSYKLENFFKGNPRRILQWFSNFAGSGDFEHGKGAKALSQFAFVNRDICWEELEWKGKHGQSPAMVATKPHYFLDLDVQRTVENFLEYVPEFGHPMSLEELEELWDVIEEFLMEQSFSFLCHHLLIILEEQDFHLFLDLIPKYLKPKSESIASGNASDWLEIVLSKYRGSSTIDQLLLLNAVTNQARQLLRLVREEGSEEEKEKIKNLVFQICDSSSYTNDLAPLMEEVSKRKPLESITRLGVHSWAIHFRLSEELRTPESWESLFISNGIKFRKSDKYTLLHDDEFQKIVDQIMTKVFMEPQAQETQKT
ncbi:UNVERIFIED_CONTAM: hypothetical protein Scaly_0277600 [Sesamum calycinum]|uniref:Uncharacterized protein n=1 Tax=Sesamum calycinum TaxID=2727403 RepID=A0AAW2SAZ4_9LAMI